MDFYDYDFTYTDQEEAEYQTEKERWIAENKLKKQYSEHVVSLLPSLLQFPESKIGQCFDYGLELNTQISINSVEEVTLYYSLEVLRCEDLKKSFIEASDDIDIVRVKDRYSGSYNVTVFATIRDYSRYARDLDGFMKYVATYTPGYPIHFVDKDLPAEYDDLYN